MGNMEIGLWLPQTSMAVCLCIVRILAFLIKDGNKDSHKQGLKMAVSGAFKMFDAHLATFLECCQAHCLVWV